MKESVKMYRVIANIYIFFSAISLFSGIMAGVAAYINMEDTVYFGEQKMLFIMLPVQILLATITLVSGIFLKKGREWARNALVMVSWIVISLVFLLEVFAYGKGEGSPLRTISLLIVVFIPLIILIFKLKKSKIHITQS